MGTTLGVPEYGAAPWGHWGHGCHACCLAGPSKGAASEAVYEELDYSLMPEYQEVPSHTGGSGMVPGAWGCPHPLSCPQHTSSVPGSLSQGAGKELSDHSGDGAEDSDLQVSPGRDVSREAHCEDRKPVDTLHEGI